MERIVELRSAEIEFALVAKAREVTKEPIKNAWLVKVEGKL